MWGCFATSNLMRWAGALRPAVMTACSHVSCLRWVWILFSSWLGIEAATAGPPGVHGIQEFVFHAGSTPTNPYQEISAEATLSRPDGTVGNLPLFWDGGDVWKLRVASDQRGIWRWKIASSDAALNGQSGEWTCVEIAKPGLQRMKEQEAHFGRQDGTRVWFMGDTQWALFNDIPRKGFDRAAARAYLKTRAEQGFNTISAMLLSEADLENSGGPPFHSVADEMLNPAFWREVDERLAFANDCGLNVGLFLAWAAKSGNEAYAWGRFPSRESRKRFARYVAARYGAFDVYFIVAGEWYGEVKTRVGATEGQIQQEFVDLGTELQAADFHRRMIGIHPMSRHSVREFNPVAPWMSFGDYQQNYRDLHASVLQSRSFGKPVVNSEYGYLFRSSHAASHGKADKDNSQDAEVMRHATWDIAMAGGYVVTGFGTTYFGGLRDAGPFDLMAAKNRPWEEQMGCLRSFFEKWSWWQLLPQDEWVTCAQPRGQDRILEGQVAPPEVTYWCLADPVGKVQIIYVRGVHTPLRIQHFFEAGTLRAQVFDLRSGAVSSGKVTTAAGGLSWTPPDERDWVLALTLK